MSAGKKDSTDKKGLSFKERMARLSLSSSGSSKDSSGVISDEEEFTLLDRPMTDLEKEAFRKVKMTAEHDGSVILDVRNDGTWWTQDRIKALCVAYAPIGIDEIKIRQSQLLKLFKNEAHTIVSEGGISTTVQGSKKDSKAPTMMLLEDFIDVFFHEHVESVAIFTRGNETTLRRPAPSLKIPPTVKLEPVDESSEGTKSGETVPLQSVESNDDGWQSEEYSDLEDEFACTLTN